METKSKSTFKTDENIEYFFMCGPKKIFSTLKLIMQPEQRFEFDMV